jgi:integral membrane protein
MLPAGVLRFDTATARLRAVVYLEGWSYLVLLFVAMPLKYFAGLPLAVRWVGSLHGALFVALVVTALYVWRVRAKPIAWGLRIGLASLVPFATFFLDPELRAEDERARQEAA